MNTFKIVTGLISTLVLMLCLSFGLNYFGLMQSSFFSPRIEAVRNKTFQESQAYNEGMLRDLQNIQLEYIKATPEGKSVLKSIAIHRFEVYPIDKLPPELQLFYSQLKGS